MLIVASAPVKAAAPLQFDTSVANGQVTILDYYGRATKVVIPSEINGLPVTTIADSAFDNSTVQSVVIPNTVVSIGNYAFTFSNLKTVTIPGSVVSIGQNAFSPCLNLTRVTMESGVTTIGDAAFENDTLLKSVTIPNSVTSIGISAFVRSGITSITIPDSVTSMGAGVFSECPNLTQATVGRGITTIGDQLSQDPKLVSVTISPSVTSLGDNAFSECGFTTLTLPDSITTLGNMVLFNCPNLKSLTLDKNITSIESYFCWQCGNLESVEFLGNAPSMDIGSFFYTGDNFTVKYYDSNTGFESPTWTDSGGDTFPSIDLGTLPTITSAGTASGNYGTAFAYTIAASGAPASFSATGLPKGLLVNKSTGVISGKPAMAGTFIVSLSAKNSIGMGTSTLTIHIAALPASVILGGLSRTYIGKPIAATATTTPARLAVTFTYNGGATVPTLAGNYTVVGTINNPNYTGSATGTMVITPILPLATTGVPVIGANTATLNATINPKGATTSVVFQYGTTTTYDHTTPSQNVAAGTANVAVPEAISGLLPQTTYHYRVVATNTAGTTNGADKAFTTLTLPVITTNATAYLAANSAELTQTVNPNGVSTQVYFEYGTSSGNYTAQTATQTIGAGKIGVPVFAQLSGLAINTTYYYRLVTIGTAGTFPSPTESSFTTLGFDMALVKQKGAAAPDIANATYNTFGNPIINSDDAVAFAATLAGTGVTSTTNVGIFTEPNIGTPHCVVQSGDPAPGINGATFALVGDPVFNNNADVAFAGQLKLVTNLVAKTTAQGIWSTSSGSLQLVARQGGAAPGTNGGTFSAFTGLALSDSAGVVLVGVLNASSTLPINASNNLGIWEGNTTNDLHLVLRTGDVVDGETVTKLTVLSQEVCVNGQTRSFDMATGDIICGATFSDSTTGVIGVIGGVPHIGLQSGGPAAGIVGASYASFGSPAINGSNRIAYAATLTTGLGGVTLTSNKGVWGLNASQGLLVAQSGTGLAPGTASTFNSFSDPVYNNNFAVAFRGTLNVAQAQASTATGVWCTGANTASLALVAQAGVTQAPGCPSGTTFSSFSGMALADQGGAGNQGGVIMLATLNTNSSAGVTAKNNLGIWAVDSAGALQLIVRTGDLLDVNGTDKTVTALSFLPTVSVVNGQTRSFAQDSGDIVYLATFDDNSTAIFTVQFP